MCVLLEAEGVHLDGIYFCPHTPEAGCTCRKPGTGLLELAAQELGFWPETSFVIGDQPSDMELGQRVGATTLLVRTGYGAQVAEQGTTTPDYIVADFLEAAQVIQLLLVPQKLSVADEARL
jgi:histidinol phosphatase-like enzyme